MENTKKSVAFDVDGTLLTFDDKPRYDVIHLLCLFSTNEALNVIVWSGGGVDYANHWIEKLGLEPYVDAILPKDKEHAKEFNVQIAFDDEDVDLAPANIRV